MEETMNFANHEGDFECHTWEELEKLIRKSSFSPFDDIWINGNTEYPCLAILLNGNYACVHYFLNDQGDMWQSVGHGDIDVAFVAGNGDKSDMPSDCVISLEEAIDCAKQFYDTLEKPTCIEWREL